MTHLLNKEVFPVDDYGNEYLINFPDAQLRVFVEPNTDLDGDFKALCLDTDQLLRIQGYNALEIILIG